jgi:LuxR family maltose regulon positive regulatory protein
VNIERAMQLLALIKFVQGETELAGQYIAEANALFEESATRYPITRRIEFDYYRMKLWLSSGNYIAASRWARDYEARRTLHSSWDILNELSFARALYANRRFDQALDVLTQCISLANEAHIVGWVIQGLVLKALCLHARQDDERALDTLCRALSLAEPEGYIRTFADAGQSLGELLTMVLVRYDELRHPDYPFSANYASRLLALIKTESLSSAQLAEPLSDRERDVLRLLASELTNQEIAENLVITVGTVKQYNHSIYRKLDVRTRAQAAQRARELNLL